MISHRNYVKSQKPNLDASCKATWRTKVDFGRPTLVAAALIALSSSNVIAAKYLDVAGYSIFLSCFIFLSVIAFTY